jgi:hypothetical protein
MLIKIQHNFKNLLVSKTRTSIKHMQREQEAQTNSSSYCLVIVWQCSWNCVGRLKFEMKHWTRQSALFPYENLFHASLSFLCGVWTEFRTPIVTNMKTWICRHCLLIKVAGIEQGHETHTYKYAPQRNKHKRGDGEPRMSAFCQEERLTIIYFHYFVVSFSCAGCSSEELILLNCFN